YTENAPKTAKNQGFERPQLRRCGLLHFPAALIRPSLVPLCYK
ncbi:IS5/IS1182 family transposase, partial [Xanthomonas oryzae pv. oryzae]